MIRLGKSLFVLLIIVIILVLMGFFIEGLRHKAEDNYKPPGEFVDDDQTRIHYIKKGQGEETVVFSSGSGTSSPYADMYHLQEEIGDSAETIVYERPGYGWSDSTDKSRSVDELTQEMDKVLDKASTHDSFIFVGHSMAALEILSYAHKHPEKVDGVVLIDGVHPEYASEMEQAVPISIRLTTFLKKASVLRLMSHFDFYEEQLFQDKDVPDNVEEIGIEFALDRMWNKTMLEERKMIPENGKQIGEEGDIGEIPLVIFSAKNNPMDGWKASQETMPDLSDQPKQIWVDTDDHFIHHAEPDEIVQEIQTLLE